jgi:glutamate/tyrosine decarboxylase-like PLP-dependent enzyme
MTALQLNDEGRTPMFETQSLALLKSALRRLEEGSPTLPSFQASVDLQALEEILHQVADRMTDNYPYAHPYYAGQMLKPPHAVARLAYTLALWINPNNHALDGGRASSKMEREAVHAIANMFGWQSYLGHLTSGGTMANLEALWVAGQLHPNKKVIASAQSHYTHQRISGVLQLPYQSVPVDVAGRMDMQALQRILQQEQDGVAVVVATLGTTAIGSVDPLPQILDLQAQYGFRVHVDAAYGGYFALAEGLSETTRLAFDAIAQADSVVIDPHKHGLQPYGCGCVLFKDATVGQLYKHDSPYTYFTSDELHLGEISLECSRAGASAVALWATQQLLPMVKGGQFAQDLGASLRAARTLHQKLQLDGRFVLPLLPELDIVVWGIRAERTSEMNQHAQRFFDEAAQQHLHLALTRLSSDYFRGIDGVEIDTDQVVCLRSCLMKAEHLDWLDEIVNLIITVANQLL